MEVFSLISVALTVLFLSIWLGRKINKNSLPGPMGLPLVGYIPFMTDKPHVKLTQLAKIYGPVYSLYLGSKNIAVITDFKDIKEAFSRDEFIGRPSNLLFELSEESIKTGAFLGKPWKEQRKFSLHTFRDLGVGKTRLEDHIKEEILELIDRMSVHKSVRMSDLLAPSMSNNIASLLFGKRMQHDDPKRQRLTILLDDIGKLSGALGWQLFFPWIRAVTKHFRVGNQGRLTRAIEDTKNFMRAEIEEHESSLDPNNIRDFLDRYLIEIQKRTGAPDNTFTRGVLADLARAFFGAGSESVRTAVDWMLLVCAAFPDVQHQIHREIDEVLGQDRFPTGQDRTRMPYTEAAVCEMMRWKSIVPLNSLRYTLQDTELNGYVLPQHTYVLAVLWAVDHDEALWGKDVFTYRPERFLSPDGQKRMKPEYFIPFSIGKRQCPGKIFAEIEIFLYLTSILQKFEFQMPPGQRADLEGELGIFLQPKRQELCIKTR